MTGTDEVTQEAPQESYEPRLIEREMRESYLTYALSVIHSRALPDVRDGLKPSQRRILVAMDDLNLGPRSKYRKCAKIAGDTSGNYHPHGEAVIYPTLVRMAQPFNDALPAHRRPGQLRLGGRRPAGGHAIHRGPHAPPRPRRDDGRPRPGHGRLACPTTRSTRTEPTVLPSQVSQPAMSTARTASPSAWPPAFRRTTCGEICAALRAVLIGSRPRAGRPSRNSWSSCSGPDFPTGGHPHAGFTACHQAYTHGPRPGRASAARWTSRRSKGGRTKQQMVVSEIPYQVNKATLIEKIAHLVKEGRLTGISDVRDESDKERHASSSSSSRRARTRRSSSTSSSSTPPCRPPSRSSTW